DGIRDFHVTGVQTCALPILSSVDAIVNFRPNYNGETSLTVLEALRHGTVPIVRRIGWFDELPDEVVFKVNKESEVIAAIETLTRSEERRVGKEGRVGRQTCH